MKFQSYFILLILSLSQLVVSSKHPAKSHNRNHKWYYIYRACMEGTNDYKWESSIKAKLTKQCQYQPILGSILICIANEMGDSTKNFQKSLNALGERCNPRAKTNYSVDDLNKIYHNATQYVIDPKTIQGNVTKIKFSQPVNIVKADIEDALRFYKANFANTGNASLYSGIMWAYFVGIFILMGVANFIKRLGYQHNFNHKVIKWYRSNISIPALFNAKHTDPFQFCKIFAGLVPTRVETLIVIGFLGLNALFLGGFHDFGSHLHFKSTEEVRNVQLMEFVADRTGLLSFGLIPLLIIFAGRNNILTTLTGIPYSTFIVFHKWVARFMWIHALIHSACWTAYAVYYKAMAEDSAETYWTWGIVATILGGLILVQAFHIFRNMAYETFLFIHIVLAILFIVGCWWHCYTLGWLEWIYVSWAVWIFDRVLRVVKMCMFGFRNAQIELIADDTFKITVKHGKWFAPYPGSFGYVYFITPTMFWQSHPFTLIDSVLNKDETTIYVKTKAGITKRLNKQLAKIPGNKKTIRISIEGPYGHRAPIEKYDTALLLAGGNGIPGPYYHAIDLSKRESSTKQQIKLTWIIRNPDALQWFHKELELLAHTNVQTDIYITAQDQNKEKLEVNVEEKKDTSSDEEGKASNSDTTSDKAPSTSEVISSLSNHINFHYGRPNLEEIIVKEFTDEKGPSVAVMSCGPPKMVDAIRNLVAKHLQESKGRVDLYEELQVW
ncbi:hypothetical protein WICANDRAFT_54650 [Wickerhamomyces anomalus NRRL Y-366-8]|uniref:ferric-chelate reductase (NADPH) n=1 Tax=Wickerhamomyces anomalus (strain ATCC 58044 / CBS 1984 / NCYC 433 / NRRL Y-366-8) TaxID=683960 RepID=A0A1E3P073_WICAA|nr:uncharacterized protein WICANDRAFT_54650 [Wickerhamomyces anomalus NRRL Y-366-8]ODQ58640.1 hypothetical protein WICANDRAFT_54650 [Wickerhamomyces anomalus NRRL Y-366-8]